MQYKYLGVDINETNCCISEWTNGTPLVIAKTNYEKPLKNQKESIGALNFTKWHPNEYHDKDQNHNKLVNILKWCDSIIKGSFPDEEIRCIVSTPSLMNELQKKSLGQAIESANLNCYRTRDKSSCSLLNENFIRSANNNHVIALNLSLNYTDAILAEIGNGVIECIKKLSCTYENTNLAEKKESISNLIKTISSDIIDPSKLYYVQITGESNIYEELKNDIAKATYRKCTSLNFEADGSAQGLAIEAGILEESISNVLLLDIVNYKINIRLNAEGGEDSVANIPFDDTFPFKQSIHIQFCEMSNLLSIEQTFPFIKGNKLYTKTSTIEAFDVSLDSNKSRGNRYELLEITGHIDANSSLSFILESDISDLIRNTFSRKSREKLLESERGSSKILQGRKVISEEKLDYSYYIEMRRTIGLASILFGWIGGTQFALRESRLGLAFAVIPLTLMIYLIAWQAGYSNHSLDLNARVLALIYPFIILFNAGYGIILYGRRADEIKTMIGRKIKPSDSYMQLLRNSKIINLISIILISTLVVIFIPLAPFGFLLFSIWKQKSLEKMIE